VYQFLGRASNRVRNEQHYSDEEPAVQVHPKAQQGRQHEEEAFAIDPRFDSVEHPAEHPSE
jgi:hypothetical protein